MCNFAYKDSTLSVVANHSRYVPMHNLITYIINNYLAVMLTIKSKKYNKQAGQKFEFNNWSRG